MEGLQFIFKNWVIMLFAVFFIYGGLSAFLNMDEQTLDTVFQDRETSTQEKVFDVTVFTIAFGAVTPALRYESPMIESLTGEKYIVGINDIPYFDPTDLLFIIPVIYVSILILQRTTLAKGRLGDFLIKVVIVIFLIMTSYLATKAIEYKIYLDTGEKLGLPKESLIETRNNILENTEEVSGVLGVIAFLGGIGGAKKIWSKLPQ